MFSQPRPQNQRKKGEKAEQGETLNDLKSLSRTSKEAARDRACLSLLTQDAKEQQADFASWATRRLDPSSLADLGWREGRHVTKTQDFCFPSQLFLLGRTVG